MEGKDVAHWGSHPRHPVLVLPEGAAAGPLALCPGRADCTDLAVPARGPPGTTGPLPMLSGHLCPSRCLVLLPPRLVRPGPLPGTSRGAGAVRHRDCPRGLPCWPCFEGTPSPTRRLSPGTAKLALTFPARCSGRTEQREAVVPGHGRRAVLVTGPPPAPSPVVCPAVAGAVWPCPWLCHSPVACTSLRSSAQGPGAVLRSLAGLGAGRWDRLPWRGEPLLPSLAEAGPSLRRPCPHVKPHGALEPQATGEKCQASQFIILVYMPSLFFQLNAVTAVDWP